MSDDFLQKSRRERYAVRDDDVAGVVCFCSFGAKQRQPVCALAARPATGRPDLIVRPPHKQKKDCVVPLGRHNPFGAGGGGRTRTVSLPLDFESSTSANSITPAGEFLTLVYYNGFFLKNQH